MQTPKYKYSNILFTLPDIPAAAMTHTARLMRPKTSQVVDDQKNTTATRYPKITVKTYNKSNITIRNSFVLDIQLL